MSALEKARLEALDGRGRVLDSLRVQFNPSSMTLQMSNSIDGGMSRGRQTQQYNGTSSTTLSLDLEFDTADEGTTARPVDVRTRTRRVAQFVLPSGEESKQAPPRVRFRWGTFELVGVMSTLTEELSLFAGGGAPLRAKLTVSIREQDPRFDALERGAGANPRRPVPAAGEPQTVGPGSPGSRGGGPADRAAPALAGETPADFLARNGLDPEAWRTLGGALDTLADGVELAAGATVEFSAALSLGAGIGGTSGFAAALDVSAEVSLGLGAAGRGTGAAPAQGFALSAAGGVTAAAQATAATAAATTAAAARADFGAPAPAPAPSDPRATSYGRGVPLRDRVAVPGSRSGSPAVVGGAAPATDVSGRSRRPGRAAPWEQLAPGPVRDGADREQLRRRPACGCSRCHPGSRGAAR